jgi:hypothetical protein
MGFYSAIRNPEGLDVFPQGTIYLKSAIGIT